MEKQLSVSDVSRLTHIRPDRIIDLEKDDYSNFPSLAYARGFLLIYARQLGVDVSEAAVRLENSNPVDIEEYEYLSGRPAPLTRSLGVGRRITAIMVILASVFIAGFLIVRHMLEYYNRIDDLSQLSQKDQASLHAVPQPTAAPQASASSSPVPIPSIAPAPDPEIRRAEAVVPAVPKNNEIVLHPVKKTWVKIQKDGNDTPPIYEDWLYPDANGLTLHGGKFWIQLGDGTGVEIRKNGQLVPYNSPGIVVQ